MKLCPVNKRDAVGKRSYKKCKNQAILEEFVASGYECVRVEEFEAKSANVAAAAMRKSCARFGFHGIEVFTRGNSLYLARTE
jgi:hypothetical protein